MKINPEEISVSVSRVRTHVEQIPCKVAGNVAFTFNIQRTVRVPIGI